MRIVILLNITLIILTAVVVADILLTVYSPVKTDYTQLIRPISVWLGLFLIRSIHISRQKTLNQLESVRINKA